MKNKVAYLVDKGKVEMGEREKPEAGKGQVLIKVKHCGICGSDVHNYIEGRTGKRIIHFPFILGHELAGIYRTFCRRGRNCDRTTFAKCCK